MSSISDHPPNRALDVPTPHAASRQTIAELFLERVRCSNNSAAFGWPEQDRDDAWQWASWNQLAQGVEHRCCQLQRLGCEPGAHVVHISGNGLDWLLNDLALQFLGCVHIPLSPLITPTQLCQIVEHCQPRLMVCEPPLLRSVAEARLAELPRLASCPFGKEYLPTSVAQAVGEVLELDPGIAAWSNADSESAVDDTDQTLHQLKRRLHSNQVSAETLLSILYTSGTTGEPKGVMLNHRNVVSNVRSKLAILPLSERDIRLAVLPWTHIFGRVCDVYTWIASGSQLVNSRGRQHFTAELQQIRPTYLNAVPYHYEHLWRAWQQANGQPGLAELCGGRLRIGNCGGAAINDQVFDDFWQAGVALITGYGLTETSPVLTSSSPTDIRRGAVGRAVPGVEIRIDSNGEVLARGDNVMLGYYRNPEATRAVFGDLDTATEPARGNLPSKPSGAAAQPWFRTGDLGHLDDDGFLYLVGRIKELIVTNGGRNIAPGPIEAAILESPDISQVMIVGDRQDFLTAVVVPASAANADRVQIQSEIDARLAKFPRHEQVARSALLSEPFTIDNGLLTAKGTLRRSLIAQRHAAVIDELYRQARQSASTP